MKTIRSRNFVFLVLALLVLALKDRYLLFLKPINNLLACMRLKIIILFHKLITKSIFYKLH